MKPFKQIRRTDERIQNTDAKANEGRPRLEDAVLTGVQAASLVAPWNLALPVMTSAL